VKLIAFILIFNLAAFYTEAAVLPFTQCSIMQSTEVDDCSKCARMHVKDMCKNAGKKGNEPCNKSASCFNCPVCSAFLPFNFNQSQTTQGFNKTVYFFYADNIISAFISETWKPPNV